jgi:hypothetical protein
MLKFAAPTAMQLAMVHAMIPEYHDEQRLKGWDDPTDRRLGPAAGIFLSPFVPDISNRKVIPSHIDVPGMLVGYVVVIQQPNETLSPNYQALHLDWGMNCLWLRSIAGNNYEAYISQPAPDSACRSNPMPQLHGPLEVRRSPLPNPYFVRDHAPAARFTDDTRQNPLLGVPCFDGWCDIGPPGFSPRPTPGYLTTRPPYYGPGESNSRRETRIKGWYDEQYLEIDSTRWGRGWVATNVRAAIVPRPRIHDAPPELVGQWRHVADVYLNQDPPGGTKYAGALFAGWNKIELMLESVGPPRKYLYRYTSSGGTYEVYDVVAEGHQDAPVPGTTRWRYSMFDSGTWVPCGENSCCQSAGF